MNRAAFSSAVQDFHRARSRAALQGVLARITGASTELLSYEQVRQMVRASGVVSRSLREVPLDAIVGSVGRYNDFTRTSELISLAYFEASLLVVADVAGGLAEDGYCLALCNALVIERPLIRLRRFQANGIHSDRVAKDRVDHGQIVVE